MAACNSPPFGEVLMVVDTDAPVPSFASHLRIDLFSEGGSWYDSRDITTLGASEWPLSFSIATWEPGEKRVRVRLRSYPEGGVRDYRGERFPAWPPFVEPAVPSTLSALCEAAPLLPMYTEAVQRRGTDVLTAPTAQSDCTPHVAGGATAMRVHVDDAAHYRFEVVRSVPNGASDIPGGDSVLFLRRSCDDPTSQVACNDDIDFSAGNFLSRFEVDLTPGDYFLLSTTHAVLSPADVTVRWGRADAWSTEPMVAMPTSPAATPRLVQNGVDVTPALEPQPNLAIDRLVDVGVQYGRQLTASVVLRGECLGTQADLANAQSCVDSAGQRVAASTATLADGIDRGGPSIAGSWSALAPSPCTKTPRAASQSAGGAMLFDDEVCIPGGAFRLGGPELIGAGDANTQPAQYAVVDPFLIDRYEVTVARYRSALAAGFVPPDGAEPLVNNGPIRSGANDPSASCTMSGDASGPDASVGSDREAMPLNCIGWYGARALCQFFGGDLPTHVQWEYVATAAGRVEKTTYPWGNDAPDCMRAVFGHGSGFSGGCDGSGLARVDEEPWASGDRTPLGVAGMAGNVTEWTQDSFHGYTHPCWWNAPLHDVGCREVFAPERSMRGGAWDLPSQSLFSDAMFGQPPSYPIAEFGVRCARSGK